MCLGGNSAPLSARYLGSQLSTLWRNAVQCADEAHGGELDVTSQDYEQGKAGRALAQYHYYGSHPPSPIHSTADFFFYARFGEPSLKFLCNHEVILTLTIDKANVNADFGKSASSGARPDPQFNKALQGVRASFRVPFQLHNAESGHQALTPHPFNHVVRLVELNLRSANLISVKSEQHLGADTEKALKFYLQQYLTYLQQNGGGVLYDVPHTAHDRTDYSILDPSFDRSEWFTGLKLHSVEVRSINEYLYWLWQNAVRLGRPHDALSACLAEISSTWVSNYTKEDHFFARFGPPEIKAFCPHEVVLFFHVDDIAWFNSRTFDGSKAYIYHDWTVAFIVDAVEEREGSVTRIKLNLESARFSAYHSKCGETDHTGVKYFNLFIGFMIEYYLAILIRYSLYIIYVSGGIKEFVPTIDLAYKPGIPPTDEQIALWTKQIHQLNFYGFDEIIALSEEGINLSFSSLWSDASRRQTDNLLFNSHYDRFTATFGAPVVRLTSGGKAIVWLTVKSGELVVVKESQRRDFWTWPPTTLPSAGEITEKYIFNTTNALAFEVDLKLAEDKYLSVGDAWRHKFTTSAIWSRFRDQQDLHTWTHLFFDFRNATYVPELSTVTGLGKGRESLSRLAALVDNTKLHLTRLADGGYNIIYSLPVALQRGMGVSSAYTSVSHQVVTKTAITTQNCGISRTAYESPVVLLLATYNFRAAPTNTVPWHDLWVIHGRTHKTVGSVYLSKDAFLETRLLPLLERVNRKTTVIPRASGIINDKFTFDVTTWAQDARRANQACPWEKDTKYHTDLALQYIWEHRNELIQREQSSMPLEHVIESNLSCYTVNKLTVPTVYHPDVLDIELKGESQLKVVGQSDGRRWSKESSATWSSPIRVAAGINHLSVDLASKITPTLSAVRSEGQTTLDVETVFAQYVPHTIDLQDVVADLKKLWETQREFFAPGMLDCLVISPIITQTGGLILQLCEQTGHETVIVEKKPIATKVYENGHVTAIANGKLSNIVLSNTTITPSAVSEYKTFTANGVIPHETLVAKVQTPAPPLYFWQPAASTR